MTIGIQALQVLPQAASGAVKAPVLEPAQSLPEGSFQSVLCFGQQAEVWGDQLEAGKAKEAVEVQESHAAPPRQAPQLPAEPCDVHHRFDLHPHRSHMLAHLRIILNKYIYYC